MNANSNIKTLKEVFPFHLLLLIFTPIIIGFFTDHELSDSRIIIINLVWIPYFTIPYLLFQKRIIYQITCILYFIIGLIEITHWLILKGPLTTTSLLVVSNTNFQESIEFLDLKASFKLLILIPYTFLFYLSIKNNPFNIQSKSKLIIYGATLLFSSIFIIENLVNERLIRKGVPQIVKVTCSFINEIKLYQEVIEKNPPKIVDAETITSNTSQTVVVVIGESSNRNHLSLYGSNRKTTPKLDSRKDIIVYDDVVSPYSNTISSVLSILSESNLDNKKAFNKSIDLLDIFHSAGFQTYWISNQSPVGIWENLITVFAKKADYCDFVNTTSNTSFESTLNTSYDAKILKPFESVINNKVKRKFIVLHLLGSHSSYKKRYPSEYDVFKGVDKKSETIAEYDNSILYNDYIIDSLIKTVEKRIAESISLIYLSDHSENVYDELDKVGHDFSKELPKSNVEIPFLIWVSPEYIKSNPEKIKSLKQNIHLPFVSDNLFHSVMDLNDIESSYLNKEKSIFNKSYNFKRKRILEDGRNYDR